MRTQITLSRFVRLTSFSLMIIILNACSPKVNDARFYSNEVQCLGVDADGNQLLKSWSYSKNLYESDQLEVAKQRAVKEVIFKGIRNGNKECSSKPLVFDMNAETKYENYFNEFFSKDGSYKDYSELINPELYRNSTSKSKLYDKGIDVRVNIRGLKKKLIEDKIIPKN